MIFCAVWLCEEEMNEFSNRLSSSLTNVTQLSFLWEPQRFPRIWNMGMTWTCLAGWGGGEISLNRLCPAPGPCPGPRRHPATRSLLPPLVSSRGKAQREPGPRNLRLSFLATSPWTCRNPTWALSSLSLAAGSSPSSFLLVWPPLHCLGFCPKPSSRCLSFTTCHRPLSRARRPSEPLHHFPI